jgi:hypothetical protein
MTDKLELKSSHEVIETVSVEDVDSIFQGKPTDPDILTVIMKDGKRLYCDEVCPMQEEPVSKDLEEAAIMYAKEEYNHKNPATLPDRCRGCYAPLMYAFKAGSKWQKENLWKPADGEDLPEIDREVIALTQPYPNDEHLRVVFAHRPNKYTKVWNSDLGEEQVVEIERYGKGEWNIPNIVYWLDTKSPYEENKITK